MSTDRSSALEPEYLVLGLLVQRPGHGYELHRRLQAEFRALWHIPQNQLYATLKRLEKRGEIVGQDDRPASGRVRRRYRVTPRGRARFRRWLEQPTRPSARALRVAFLTRLALARAENRGAATRIFTRQWDALQAAVERLREVRGTSTEELERLALDLRVRQLETALTWMAEARKQFGLTA